MKKKSQKSNKRSMARTMARECQRKAKRHTTHGNQEKGKRPLETKKKGKKLVPFVVGSYFTHNPYVIAYMQIVRFKSNGKPRTSITRQNNLPLYNKG